MFLTRANQQISTGLNIFLMQRSQAQLQNKDCWIRWFLKVSFKSKILAGPPRTRVRALVQEDATCHGATKPVCHNC